MLYQVIIINIVKIVLYKYDRFSGIFILFDYNYVEINQDSKRHRSDITQISRNACHVKVESMNTLSFVLFIYNMSSLPPILFGL